MLAHERGSSGYQRRVGQAYRTADHGEPTARRVVDVIDHAALTQVRIGEHLSRIEDGTADHPATGEGLHHLMFAARARPAFENLGQRRGVSGPRRRCGKALVLLQLGLADDLRHRDEHLWVVGRDNEVDRLVRAGAGATDQVGVAAGRRAVAGTTERLAVPQSRRELDPGQLEYGFLHRHLNELALAGAAPLYEGREDAYR